MKTSQSAVFNRTGRQRILADCVGFRFDGEVLRIQRLSGDDWSGGVEPGLLGAAVLHFDVRSLLYEARRSLPMTEVVLGDGWNGIDIKLASVLFEAGYRIKLQVTIALPATHADGGRILARSEELVVRDGDIGEEDDDGKGGSLLPTRPDPQLESLCRLEFEHTGPVLLVNSSVQGVSWREIATNPYFKHGVFLTCLEQVLLHIALTDAEDRPAWTERWLSLPGVVGTDVEVAEEDSSAIAYLNAREWARVRAKAVAVERGAMTLFMADQLQRR